MKFKILFVVSCLLAATGISHADNLFPQFGGKIVKVFVANVKDSTKDHEVNSQTLRNELEKALTDRKSIHFQVVPTTEEAQIVIDTDIKEFMWTDHDPIDMLIGVVGIATDAVYVEDYARLQADVTITDKHSQRPLWKERVLATVTKKPMSKVESLPIITKNFVEEFIKNCFSKRRKS